MLPNSNYGIDSQSIPISRWTFPWTHALFMPQKWICSNFQNVRMISQKRQGPSPCRGVCLCLCPSGFPAVSSWWPVMTRGTGKASRSEQTNRIWNVQDPKIKKKHKIWKWGTGEHPWSSITFQYPCSFDDSQSRIFFVDTLPAQTECEPPLALFHPTRAISLDLELVAAFPSHPWKTKQRFEMWRVSYLEKAKLFHCPEISQEDPCWFQAVPCWQQS